FPSTVAAALTALIIFAWGSQVSGRRTGMWAAVIFTLSLQTFVHAKAAVADMWLVLFMTAAAWGGYEWSSNPSKRRTPNIERRTPNLIWWWTFYIALALAFLAKGPIGLLPLIPFAWMSARAPKMSFFLPLSLGLLLTLGLICLWAVPALIQTHGEFLRI